MKERKIGEIFEHNGEWYQCVKSPDGSCKHCDMNFGGKCPIPTKECMAILRSDLSYVIFKKLEKIGEPFSDEYFGLVQKYELKMYGYSTTDKRVCFADGYDVFIKIKQNKEDMEEKKLNLKPFDIQKAREGKPVCTRDGRKARILCYDLKGAEYPIVAAVETRNCFAESICGYDKNGRFDHDTENNNDLMMLPEKKEGWVNVYKGIDGVTLSQYPYTSKDEAIKESEILFGRIDTIKVSWEE